MKTIYGEIIYQDIISWIKMTNNIVETFIYDYFDDVNPNYFWVNQEVGESLYYGDYCFSFLDIITVYKMCFTKEQFFMWYEDRKSKNNLKNLE